MVDMALPVPGSESIKAIGDIELVGADAPHRELLEALGSEKEILADILAATLAQDWQIFTLSGAAVTLSQYSKLRVQYIIISNSGAIADGTLLIGTARYVLSADTGLRQVRFPIVIERGTDMSWSLAGSLAYLIGTVE